MHKPQVPKADVHQLFFTRRSDINSLLEIVERYKGSEETKLWSERRWYVHSCQEGAFRLYHALDCEKVLSVKSERRPPQSNVEYVLFHGERRGGQMKRNDMVKGT